MEAWAIVGTLTRMATQRRRMAADLAAAAADAEAEAKETDDPRAADALQTAAYWLRAAAYLLGLHGWVEEALAELVRGTLRRP